MGVFWSLLKFYLKSQVGGAFIVPILLGVFFFLLSFVAQTDAVLIPLSILFLGFLLLRAETEFQSDIQDDSLPWLLSFSVSPRKLYSAKIISWGMVQVMPGAITLSALNGSQADLFIPCFALGLYLFLSGVNIVALIPFFCSIEEQGPSQTHFYNLLILLLPLQIPSLLVISTWPNMALSQGILMTLGPLMVTIGLGNLILDVRRE
jgi:hypothetical protein